MPKATELVRKHRGQTTGFQTLLWCSLSTLPPKVLLLYAQRIVDLQDWQPIVLKSNLHRYPGL